MAEEKVITQSDIDKLTKALAAERAENKSNLVLLNAAKKTIADAAALGTAPSPIAVSQFIADGVKAGVAHATNELHLKVTDLESQLTTANAAAADSAVKLVTRSIAVEVRTAAREAHVLPTAINDLISLGNIELKMVDGKVVNAEGIDVATWIDNRKASAPYLWPVSRGAGSRGNDAMPGAGAPNPWSRETWNMTLQGNLVKSDPQAAERMRASAVQ